MSRKKVTALVLGIVITATLLAALGVELTRGLSLTRGFHNLTVKDIYAMGSAEGKLYLSIDLDPAETHLTSIRVALNDILLDVNPGISSDVVISSADAYIWGDRWPWVEKVTITLKTSSQKEGFAALLRADNLKQMQTDLNKGLVVGVTSSGLLTSGGRIVDY